MGDIAVKVCGLRRGDEVAAAVAAGVRYLGFNFFPPSPRSITPAEAAALGAAVPPGVARVGLFVDPTDALLAGTLAVAPLDIVQLHGSETPARVAEVRARFGLPVMKAVGVADAVDLAAIAAQGRVADMLLIDAKPPRDAVLPGGNGLAFDWRLIAGRRWPCPWMLAGGLKPGNVAEAIRLTGARQVDVASGVESAPGIKDPARIRAFVEAARAGGPRLRPGGRVASTVARRPDAPDRRPAMPETAPLEADIALIQRILPHRYPFLLVDKVRDIVPGTSCTGIKNVTFNEPQFQGHFPQVPVFPGVLVIEAMAQTAAVLVGVTLDLADKGTLVYFMGIDGAKFRRKVGPGDVLELRVTVTRGGGKVWRFDGQAFVGADLVAEASFTAMMDRPKG